MSYTLQKDPDYSAQFTCLPTEVAISDLILLTVRARARARARARVCNMLLYVFMYMRHKVLYLCSIQMTIRTRLQADKAEKERT